MVLRANERRTGTGYTSSPPPRPTDVPPYGWRGEGTASVEILIDGFVRPFSRRPTGWESIQPGVSAGPAGRARVQGASPARDQARRAWSAARDQRHAAQRQPRVAIPRGRPDHDHRAMGAMGLWTGTVVHGRTSSSGDGGPTPGANRGLTATADPRRARQLTSQATGCIEVRGVPAVTPSIRGP